MFPNYKSLYTHFANQTIYWLPADSKEMYENNLLNHRNELEENGWINRTLSYKFNSLGFRSEEFTDEPSIMTLGCSYTMGTALPVEIIWPELVAKKLNMKCANLGIGGGSLDTAFRLCYGHIDQIKPKLVICMTPPGVRFEVIEGICIHRGLLATNDTVIKSFFKLWAGDENNNFFNQQKNILAIKMLCDERKIKFISVTDSDLRDKSNARARDLKHPGIESHRLFAEQLISQI